MNSKRPIAAVSMVYNEPRILPIWERHYHRQVGAENCYVLDHGSDDGCTHSAKSQIVRLPRSVSDETQRAKSVSNFCAALFFYYDVVVYSDIDELIVADPNCASTLAEYVEVGPALPAITVFGLDVLHEEKSEESLDPSRNILKQRRLARPLHSLCKPLFIRERKDWKAGFHLYDETPVFRDLYLFHVAYADAQTTVERQRKRNISVPTDGVGEHHRIAPDHMLQHIRDLIKATAELVDLGGCSSMRRFIESPADGLLWQLPRRFGDVV